MRAMAGGKVLRASIMTAPSGPQRGLGLREIARQLALEFREIARDHRHVELSQDRLLWLAIEQETEGGLDALLVGMPAARQAPQRVARHGDVVTGLALSDAHHDVEAKRIAVGGAPDLDHGSLTAPRAAGRQSSGHPPSADWTARSARGARAPIRLRAPARRRRADCQSSASPR